ncbi:MAG: TauD/TfdA family dioxygenase, partial [Terriglobia bacterium]
AKVGGLISVGDALRSRAYTLRYMDDECDIGHVAGSHLINADDYGLQAFMEDRLPKMRNPYEDTENFLLDAELNFHDLPRKLRAALIDFKRNSNIHGALVIKHLPGDQNLPPTPPDSRRSHEKERFCSEFWLAVFGTAIGDPIAYSQEKDGEIFQNVCPTASKATLLSSESSNVLLDFHTETAFHPFMPDYVLLYCLRPDHDRTAKTIVAGVRELIHLIPLRYRALLFEDSFQTGVDFSFGSESGLQGNGPVLPVLHGSPYDPFMKFDLDLMVGLSEDAAAALEQMRLAANKAKRWSYLDEGDMILIDNRRAIHGRSEFEARYDGRDRWLQRVYVARDLGISEADRLRNERVIHTEFAI